MSVAANATAERARCRPGAVTSAAMPKSTSAPRAGASRRGWASRAAITSATSGGSASAASTRWAAPSEAAPLITASSTAHDANSAVSLSQAPGLGTGEPPAKIAQRSRGRDVRNTVEVPGGRRRRRVPLERVGQPGVVGGARAGACGLDDVDEEQQQADRHHAGSDRGDEVVRLHEAMIVIREVPARHSHQTQQVLREEGEVEADEDEPELQLAEALVE